MAGSPVRVGPRTLVNHRRKEDNVKIRQALVAAAMIAPLTLGSAGCGLTKPQHKVPEAGSDCDLDDQRAKYEEDCGYWVYSPKALICTGKKPHKDARWLDYRWVVKGKKSFPPKGWQYPPLCK
jgi:hypothetical protein